MTIVPIGNLHLQGPKSDSEEFVFHLLVEQMLAIGRALMSNPKLLLLDEPSMGLAPVLVDTIFETIQELHQLGATILLVEQNARKALEIADRGYVLQSGEIVLSSPAESLRANEMVQ